MTKSEIRTYRLKHGLVGLTNSEIVAHANAAKGMTIMASTMGEIGGFIDEYTEAQISQQGLLSLQKNMSMGQLTHDIGEMLNDPSAFMMCKNNTSNHFTGATAAYLHRIGVVKKLKALSHNTIFLTFYEEAGGFARARLAGSGFFNCSYQSPRITAANDEAVYNNLDYSKDNYTAHSRYQKLNVRPTATWR